MKQWSEDKYAHVPATTIGGTQPSARHKFPKEKKPALADVLRDVALLLAASLYLGEPIFIWVEDAAFYFNQFGYSPESLWLSNLVVNARAGDMEGGGRTFKAGQLVFISEKRLGFGSYASSNIAQRFSNALTGWVMEEFDKLESDARRAEIDQKWESWVAMRTPLDGSWVKPAK